MRAVQPGSVCHGRLPGGDDGGLRSVRAKPALVDSASPGFGGANGLFRRPCGLHASRAASGSPSRNKAIDRKVVPNCSSALAETRSRVVSPSRPGRAAPERCRGRGPPGGGTLSFGNGATATKRRPGVANLRRTSSTHARARSPIAEPGSSRGRPESVSCIRQPAHPPVVSAPLDEDWLRNKRSTAGAASRHCWRPEWIP